MRFIKVIDEQESVSYIAINKIASVDDSTDSDISVRIDDGADETYQFDGEIEDFMRMIMSNDPLPVFRSPRED